MNLRNLERVLAREEEVKKKAVVHKALYEGPTIRFCSRDGNCSFRLSSIICLHVDYGLSNYSLLGFLFSMIGIHILGVVITNYQYCAELGISHLEFINGASFGSELSTTSTPCKCWNFVGTVLFIYYYFCLCLCVCVCVCVWQFEFKLLH